MKTLKQLLFESEPVGYLAPALKYTPEMHKALSSEVKTHPTPDLQWLYGLLDALLSENPSGFDGQQLLQYLKQTNKSSSDVAKIAQIATKTLQGDAKGRVSRDARHTLQILAKFAQQYKEKNTKMTAPEKEKPKPQWMPKSDFSNI